MSGEGGCLGLAVARKRKFHPALREDPKVLLVLAVELEVARQAAFPQNPLSVAAHREQAASLHVVVLIEDEPV